jgi:hypothetical protein
MKVRQLTSNDLKDIEWCIRQHKTCYTVPIRHDEVISRVMELTDSGYVCGVYDGQDCVGICTQSYWSRRPVWTISNLYLSIVTDNLYMGKKHLDIIGLLMENTILKAESKNIFEFYYVIRDNLDYHVTRKKQGFDSISQSSSYVATRYRFENIHYLKSVNDIKWEYIKDLIGNIGASALEKNKSLLIRRATILPEFRTI